MKVEINSKKIKEGDTFVAIKGEYFDGHKYIEEAIKNGAKLIIAEHGTYSVPTLLVENTRKYLSEYLKDLYSKELENINLIGITGTNGKTTTAYLIYQALNKLNINSAYIGTIGFYLDNHIEQLEHTTPNITDTYLDLHKTIENYANAKKELFNQILSKGCAIINIDDQYATEMLNENNRNITYGFKKSMYQILNYCYDKNRMYFNYKYDNNTYNVMTKLLGKHNIYNLMALIAVLDEFGIDNKEILRILGELDAPSGRLEVINYGNNKIIVDYAHTLDAVNNVLNTAKEFSTGKIYSIIGCGGDRDRTKRSPMLKGALELSDKVIVTNDNPRKEDPYNIVNDMLEGNKSATNYEVILDRKQAIKRGISLLEENDTLMILGKGHENYQIIGDTKYHHDDKETVLQYIKKR